MDDPDIETQIDKYKLEIASLRAQLQISRSQIDRLVNSIPDFETLHSKLKDTSDKLCESQTKCESLQMRLNQTQQMNKQLRETLKSKEESASIHQNEVENVTSYRDKLEMAQNDIAIFLTTIETFFHRRFGNLSDAREYIVQQPTYQSSKKLSSKISSLASHNSDLESKLERYAQYKTECRTLRHEKSELVSKIDELSTINEHLSQQRDESASLLKDQTIPLESLQEENRTLKQTVESLSIDKASVIDQYQQLAQKARHLASTNQALQRELERVPSSQNPTLLVDEIDRLSSELREANSVKNQAMKLVLTMNQLFDGPELQFMQNQVTSQDEVTKLQQEIENLKKTHAENLATVRAQVTREANQYLKRWQEEAEKALREKDDIQHRGRADIIEIEQKLRESQMSIKRLGEEVREKTRILRQYESTKTEITLDHDTPRSYNTLL